jgi:hypothetical protein
MDRDWLGSHSIGITTALIPSTLRFGCGSADQAKINQITESATHVDEVEVVNVVVLLLCARLRKDWALGNYSKKSRRIRNAPMR